MEEDPEISNSTDLLLQMTDNCTDEEAYLNYWMESGLNNSQMNVSTDIPLQYAQPLYGIFMPILIVITIVVNTLIVLVLAKKKMRSPTNTVLLCMAISDMLTVLFPAPWLIYMYTFGNHFKPFHSVPACYAFIYMNDVLPNLFHTSSIWLTLALAIQRYVYVCRVVLARILCTIPRVVKAIVLIYALAVFHQSTRFFEFSISEVPICWQGKVHFTCRKELAYWVTDIITPNIYYHAYFWFRVIFIHLVPCISLLWLNIMLFRTLKEARDTRAKLFSENNSKTVECKKLRDSQCTTLMLIVVVTVFLLVEIPLAILTILHIVSSSFVEFLNYDVVNVLILFSNFSISASYPVNFAIYCGMSRQFRETFKELFIESKQTNDARVATRNRSSRYSRVNGRRSCTNETAL